MPPEQKTLRAQARLACVFLPSTILAGSARGTPRSFLAPPLARSLVTQHAVRGAPLVVMPPANLIATRLGPPVMPRDIYTQIGGWGLEYFLISDCH